MITKFWANPKEGTLGVNGLQTLREAGRETQVHVSMVQAILQLRVRVCPGEDLGSRLREWLVGTRKQPLDKTKGG